MNRFVHIITLIVSLVFLSSCFCPLTSVNPLSDPKDEKYDKQLEGAWQVVSQNDNLEFLHFGKDEDKRTQMVIVEHVSSGRVDISAFTVFPTITGGKSYLNLRIEELFEEFGEELSGYTFMKYELSNSDTLTLFYLDEKPIIEAIKSGQLKGEITYLKTAEKKGDEKTTLQQNKNKSTKCVKISDSSNNILKYIQSVDPNALFPESIKLKRIK